MKYYTTNEPMQPIYSVDKPGFHQLIYKQYQLISRKHFIAYVCSTLEDSSYTSQVFIQQMGGKAGYPLLQISDQNATKFQQRKPKSPKLKKKNSWGTYPKPPRTSALRKIDCSSFLVKTSCVKSC